MRVTLKPPHWTTPDIIPSLALALYRDTRFKPRFLDFYMSFRPSFHSTRPERFAPSRRLLCQAVKKVDHTLLFPKKNYDEMKLWCLPGTRRELHNEKEVLPFSRVILQPSFLIPGSLENEMSVYPLFGSGYPQTPPFCSPHCVAHRNRGLFIWSGQMFPYKGFVYLTSTDIYKNLRFALFYLPFNHDG